jgi:putative oxygen-independent coproporphyrinogen III oxidase
MTIATSLYIHIPWCIKKCPYCDFNSHQKTNEMDEHGYVIRLIEDFARDFTNFPREKLHSIFIGGGTPSLFSPSAYALLFEGLQEYIKFPDELEITLEANPGAVDSGRFMEYRSLGINRLSVGVQSFQNEYLKKLGRVHDAKAAHEAIMLAKKAGFSRINIDLMYGLPGQSVEHALNDLNQAIDCQTEHVSWYELTIEPNTIFYTRPPVQPAEETYQNIELEGRALLASAGLQRYEISAYAKSNAYCQHNLNYWLFGDYFGIGAGAHGKLTLAPQKMIRTAKLRQPSSYMQATDLMAEQKSIEDVQDFIFEFMLNTSRLMQSIPIRHFSETTGFDESFLRSGLEKALELGLIKLFPDAWQLTEKGQLFNNEFIQLFLEY